ncbi:MAG: ABC transporter permease [Oscillospiraceae bacterium]|nr:ABC transporter permease [Oscillospiraceae bacterium]
MEFLRTKRLLGLACVFAFFAITSPLLARYMVEFLAAMVPAEEALAFIVPDPVWTDSYTQFYGNIVQLGTITLILLFMGAISAEKSRGTADLVMTKGLSHVSFVLSKFTVMALALLVTMAISIGVVYGYTYMLFDMAGSMADVFFGAVLSALSLLMLVALTLFASAIAKSSVLAALLAFAGFLAISAVSALPRIGNWLPGNLGARSLEITSGGGVHPDLWWNVGTTMLLTAVFLLLAVLVIRRREGE